MHDRVAAEKNVRKPRLPKLQTSSDISEERTSGFRPHRSPGRAHHGSVLMFASRLRASQAEDRQLSETISRPAGARDVWPKQHRQSAKLRGQHGAGGISVPETRMCQQREGVGGRSFERGPVVIPNFEHAQSPDGPASGLFVVARSPRPARSRAESPLCDAHHIADATPVPVSHYPNDPASALELNRYGEETSTCTR
jgi:hypothetical protein